MPATVEIPLSTPIKGHGGPVSTLTLREPTAGDFFALGEPVSQAFQKTGDGPIFYTAENTDVVRQYVERLVQAPLDALLIGQLALRDAIAVKEAVLGFFTAARAAESSAK